MHCRQLEQNYCVPACCVMVETWRGYAPTDVERRQRDLYTDLRLSESHLPTVDIAAVKLGAEKSGYMPTVNANAVGALAAMLRDKRAIITCFAGPAGSVMSKRGLASPFGQPHSNRLPHHAIVALAGESSIVVHDPWFEADGQPVSLSNREVIQLWTGYVALFGRVPAT